jgi:hypothetical protein
VLFLAGAHPMRLGDDHRAGRIVLYIAAAIVLVRGPAEPEWRGVWSANAPGSRLNNHAARHRQSVAIVAAIRLIPISVRRPVCSVSVSRVPVVPVPIRAPMYPAINARNAPWSEGTTNNR